MAFVEAMVIEVSRATVPERPLRDDAVPGLRVRGGDGALRVRQAGHPVRDGAVRPRARARRADGAPASGFRVFDETLAAGGRVKGIAAPGMGGVTRREIDELTELAKRFGAKGLVHLAVGDGGELPGPIAKFLSAETQAAIRDAPAPATAT